MKKSVVCIVGCLLSIGASAYAETLTFSSLPFCPYHCADTETGKLEEQPGYIYEIVQAVFEAQGHTVKIAIRPFLRAIKETREGKFTGILGTTKEHIPDFVFPDQEQGGGQACMYVKAGNPWRYEGVPSLSEVRLGVMIGAHFAEFQEYVEQHQGTDAVQLVGGENATEKNVKKLLAGRVDVIHEGADTLAYFLKQQGWEDRIQQAGCIRTFRLYTAFSPALPQSREYARILSEGMEALRESGQLQAILDKYGLKDWKDLKD
jgi:polar amino acid transport system substrate-binding protein